MRTRFAPSPTGYLHLGHAFAAKQAFGAAKENSGVCLLRIEDIDHTRCKPEYTEAIYDDLRWLGFEWPEAVRVQSRCRADYEKTLEALKSKGLLYPCFLTRREINAQTGGDRQTGGTLYLGPKTPLSDDEVHSRMARGETPAWRLSVARCRDFLGEGFNDLTYEESGETYQPAPFGDEVLARKDIGLSYHLCCVHDDAAQGITHIVRGADIAPLTPFHVLLQKLMGWPVPRYHHHKLLRRADGDKLAKRNADTAVRQFRAAGHSPQEVLAMASALG